jgi:hypothetical protein
MSAQYRSEYSKPSVNGNACTYNSLGCYLGQNSTMPAVKAGQTSGVYLTPNYSAIGYNALTHGESPGCQSYFSITDAYGKGAGSCNTSYTRRLCGGCGDLGGDAWRCAPNAIGGGKCIPAQAGTRGGPTYKSQDACQKAGCPHRV